MHRSFYNPAPVTNKYLAYKQYLKDQENHELNLKNVHGLLDQSPPTARPHVSSRDQHHFHRDYEQDMIENENDRLRSKMMHNGAFIDSHNHYKQRSLNKEKKDRDDKQHESVMKRLNARIHGAKTNYSTRKYEKDFAKQQGFKSQITRFPSTHH